MEQVVPALVIPGVCKIDTLSEPTLHLTGKAEGVDEVQCHRIHLRLLLDVALLAALGSGIAVHMVASDAVALEPASPHILPRIGKALLLGSRERVGVD